MIYKKSPIGFNPKFEVTSCFLERDGRFLLLSRQDHKPQGGTWGVPAGKVSEGETPSLAMARELSEETGVEVREEDFQVREKLFVRYSDYDFIYHVFYLPLGKEAEIVINPGEHKEYKWVTPAESLATNLIQDMDSCIRFFYRI